MLFYRFRIDPTRSIVLTCGPEVMIRFVVFEALARRVPTDQIFVSLERNMKCGAGLLRPLPARPVLHLQGRPGIPVHRPGAVLQRGGFLMPAPCKTTVAIFKFSSCDGCQLQLLNMEDELMALAGEVEHGLLPGSPPRARSPARTTSPWWKVRSPRRMKSNGSSRSAASPNSWSRWAPAPPSGGIQALRNFADADEYARTVYQHPEFLHYLPKATPIAEHVPVDLELWGCPINRVEVLEVITALLQNRKPILPQHSVCLDCKRRGTVCVMVAKGTQCLGPVTQAGCNALCPSCGRGCYGCFGPMQNMDMQTLIPTLRSMERQPGDTVRLLRHVAGYAPAFHQAAEGILAEEKKA